MPYTNPISRLVFPIGITSWGSIRNAGTQLMAECLKQGSSSGGEIFVKDSMHTILRSSRIDVQHFSDRQQIRQKTLYW